MSEKNLLKCECGYIAKSKKGLAIHKTKEAQNKEKMERIKENILEKGMEADLIITPREKKLVPFSKTVASEVGVMRYIRFFYDRRSKESKLFSDSNKDNNFDYAGGTYTLKDVAWFHEGKPVYVIISGFPFSIGFDFNMENAKLVERGYDAHDMANALTSKHINRIFKLTRKITVKEVVFWLMCNVITAMTTVFICLAIFLK